MKRFFVLAMFLIFSMLLQLSAQNVELKVIKVPELEALLDNPSEKLRVINFWATWCKPCIKELPFFLKAQKEFPAVEFIYISLDFVENISKANSFALKKGMASKGLYLIDDMDYNSWIDKVSPDWSGAIPATLMVMANQKILYEQEFHAGELETIIKEKIKQ